MTVTAVGAAAVALSASAAPAQAACAGAGLMLNPANGRQVEAAMVCLTNEARGAVGVAQLHTDPRLETAARTHAEDMLRRDYFGDVDPDGHDERDRLNAVGYPTNTFYAENLAGVTELSTVQQVFDQWMANENTRGNILAGGLRDIGTSAILPTSGGTGRMVAMFGTGTRVAAPKITVGVLKLGTSIVRIHGSLIGGTPGPLVTVKFKDARGSATVKAPVNPDGTYDLRIRRRSRGVITVRATGTIDGVTVTKTRTV